MQGIIRRLDTNGIEQHPGTTYYVDAAKSDDTLDGLTPDTAKQTIGGAVTAASAGDRIIVKGGTYTETGLDISKASLDVIFAPGVVIDPASGTALTVSGAKCKLSCPGSGVLVTPAAAQTGVAITGTFVYISDFRVSCSSSAAIGFHIGSADNSTKGDGAVLYNCRCASPTTAAFKIQASKVRLDTCCTGGESGDSSIGFWFAVDGGGVCDKARLRDCGSQGHETAGFQVDTGCTGGAIESCYSGGGDGKCIDVDNSFVWSNFEYDETLHKDQTLTGSGATVSDNLFQFYGTVEVKYIRGIVTTAIGSNVTNVYINAYDGTNTVSLSKTTTRTLSSAPIDSLIQKVADSDEVLGYLASDQARLYEDDSKYGVDRTFILNAKRGVNNYLRMTYTTTDEPTEGAIRWYIEYRPLSNSGFVKAV